MSIFGEFRDTSLIERILDKVQKMDSIDLSYDEENDVIHAKPRFGIFNQMGLTEETDMKCCAREIAFTKNLTMYTQSGKYLPRTIRACEFFKLTNPQWDGADLFINIKNKHFVLTAGERLYPLFVIHTTGIQPFAWNFENCRFTFDGAVSYGISPEFQISGICNFTNCSIHNFRHIICSNILIDTERIQKYLCDNSLFGLDVSEIQCIKFEGIRITSDSGDGIYDGVNFLTHQAINNLYERSMCQPSIYFAVRKSNNLSLISPNARKVLEIDDWEIWDEI